MFAKTWRRFPLNHHKHAVFEKNVEIKNKNLFTELIDIFVETVVKHVGGNLDTSVDSPETDRETETDRWIHHWNRREWFRVPDVWMRN